MKTKLNHITWALLCLFTIAFAACQQNKPNTTTVPITKLTVKRMQADLAILWGAIKELHPAYGIYTPADSMQVAYSQVLNSIDSPLTQTEFIDHVYPFLCKLRCGHTQLRHSEDYKPAGPKEPHLPFEVLVRNKKAWITTHTTDKLNTGDELLSVNDIPVKDIITHGYDLYSSDGYGETFKELFLSEYDGFEDACFKYYHWMSPYRVKLKTKTGELKQLTLDTASAAQQAPAKVTNNFADWTDAKNTDYLPLRFLKNTSTAYFEAKTFQYNDTNIYKPVFKQIHEKGIKTLVLDMRHNTGGDIRIATRLLAYLADGPFHIIKDIKSRIPDPSASHFEKYFDTARTTSFKTGFKPGPKEGDWYRIDFRPAFGQFYGALPTAKADQFRGKLIVLIDGATFSSAALFTSALKAQNKSAKFIGRETAGAEEGCNGGTLQHLTLPNTQVFVEFPWMRLDAFTRSAIHGRGIMPDYTVLYSPEDVVTKNDLDLKKALSLIDQKK